MVRAEERSIGYQPALDGVRAFAVALVLFFHLGFGWMSGGYLGVSVFFTLSGFLITSLLVTELQRSGTIRLGRFYGRRARRLLPASVLCLVLVCFLIANDQVPDRSGLRWYVFGALFQFANWVPLALHNSYGELFDVLSPTDHFWSLAIEEQFYWFWPLTMLLLFKLTLGRHRASRDWMLRVAIWLGVVFVVLSISAPLTAALWNSDAAYFATWARIPEILAGALLAMIVLRNGTVPAVRYLAPVCLVAIVALSVITPAGRGFAYRGALPLFGLISAGLIAGLQQPSPVRSLLSTWPFVFLGRISYGVYLYHWPVFVVLNEGRTNLGILSLSALRLAVTFAIAIASFYLVEQPIRERRFFPKPQLGLGATAMAIPAVALLAFAEVSNTSSFEQSSDTLPAIEGTVAPLTPLVTDPPGSPSVSTPVTTPATSTPSAAVTTSPGITTSTSSTTSTTTQLVPTRPVRMMVVGDSTAQVTGTGMLDWAKENPDLAQVEIQAFGGCGILDEGDRYYRGEWLPTSPGCVGLLDETVPARVRDGQPDVVVVVSSFWDNVDHRWPDDPTPRSALDPVYRERAIERFTEFNQMLLDAGAPRVTWVLYPAVDESWQAIDETSDDPARHEAFHEIEREVAANFPGQVSVIDLAAWSDEQGLTDDHAARPDGVHFTPEIAQQIVADWLGNQVIQTALH